MDSKLVRYTFILFLSTYSLCFLSLNCTAQDVDSEDSFRQGNSLYAKGQYDIAIKEYEKLIKDGLESGNLYFNIGNSYFKKGDLGRAVLNYERARRFIPTDSDLKSNYQYALSKVSTSAVRVEKKWFPEVLDKIFGEFTIDNLTMLLFFIYLSAVFLIIISMYIPMVRRSLAVIVLGMAVIALMGGIELKNKISGIGTQSIVIDETVSVRFEPFDRATTFFQLNGGDKVEKLDSKDGWLKIKRADGRIGWVKSTSVEVI